MSYADEFIAQQAEVIERQQAALDRQAVAHAHVVGVARALARLVAGLARVAPVVPAKRLELEALLQRLAETPLEELGRGC